MVLTFCFPPFFFFSKSLPHFPHVTPLHLRTHHPPTSTTRHPSLHLKNRMKPIECRRAFQHPSRFFWLFFFSQIQLVSPALGFFSWGSFAASSRVRLSLSSFSSSILPALPPLLTHSYSATSTLRSEGSPREEGSSK